MFLSQSHSLTLEEESSSLNIPVDLPPLLTQLVSCIVPLLPGEELHRERDHDRVSLLNNRPPAALHTPPETHTEYYHCNRTVQHVPELYH